MTTAPISTTETAAISATVAGQKGIVDSIDIAWAKKLTVNKPGSRNHGQSYIQAHISDGEGNWQALVNVWQLTPSQKLALVEAKPNCSVRCLGYFSEKETEVVNKARATTKKGKIRNLTFLDFEYEVDEKGNALVDKDGDRIPVQTPIELERVTKHAKALTADERLALQSQVVTIDAGQIESDNRAANGAAPVAAAVADAKASDDLDAEEV